MSEWQPIETAPKGRHVLLYRPSDEWVGVGSWTEWRDDNGEWHAFWHEAHDEAEKWSRAHVPTHWMPLPEPPK